MRRSNNKIINRLIELIDDISILIALGCTLVLAFGGIFYLAIGGIFIERIMTITTIILSISILWIVYRVIL